MNTEGCTEGMLDREEDDARAIIEKAIQSRLAARLRRGQMPVNFDPARFFVREIQLAVEGVILEPFLRRPVAPITKPRLP